jgi:hypothetical protein
MIAVYALTAAAASAAEFKKKKEPMKQSVTENIEDQVARHNGQ